MSSFNQFGHGQTWPNPSATNDIPPPPHPLTTQQHGAFTPHHQPRRADTVNPAIHGQIHAPQFSPTSLTHPKASHPTVNATSHDHIRGHQPPVVSPTLSRPTEDLIHPGLEQLSPASDHQQWAHPGDGGSGGHFPLSPGQPPIYAGNVTSPGRRPSNSAPDAKCRIPDCTYKAYYDYSEQEQTEYCGQGHELQAVSTGLVASCVMCKGRPRLTGERVCGRTCRDRERLAPRAQGSYYGVPVDRPREPRARLA